MAKIKKIKARQILDSRGNPTVEVDLVTDKGLFRGMAPSGASVGSHEAVELRDKGEAFGGNSVLKAVKNVNEIIAPEMIGRDPVKQKELDGLMIELDGTENKSRLGANAIVALSMAVCRAGAAEKGIPLYKYIGKLSGNNKYILPVPQLNVINGGKHAGLENDIQEQMYVPVKAKSFSEAIRIGSESYYALKEILKHKFGAQGTLVGDEGGFVPLFKTVHDRLEVMVRAIEESGYSNEIFLALDCAAAEFCRDNRYYIGDLEFSSSELVDYYSDLVKTFKIISVEDGFAEDDWEGWAELTKKLGNKIQIVGDDLLATNIKRIEKAMEKRACNSLLLKVNQVGTVSESIDAANHALKNGWKVVVSHRSGETEDSFIADLAVGLGCGQSKFGGPARSDRNAKYNQLLRIEGELQKKGKAFFAGESILK